MFSKKLSVVIAGILVAFFVAMPSGDAGLVGGVSELSGDDLKSAEEVLNSSLSKLAAGDGPNYKLSKLLSASRQVVSGSLYKYKVELATEDGKTKDCDVEIWSQPWLPNGIQVTFNCAGEGKLVKKHSA